MKRASWRLSPILFVCALGGLLTQPAAGAAAKAPVAWMRMGPETFSISWAACNSRACSWVFRLSGSRTTPFSRPCRLRATPTSPAS